MKEANDQLRIRVTWLYYIEGLTQSAIAKLLGVNRILVTRLLSEARSRGEVVVKVKSQLAKATDLQLRLERQFDLQQAIVAPFDNHEGDPTQVIAAAAAGYVSDVMKNNLMVGVGWGRTLHAMLSHIEGRHLKGVRVVSLLGGIALAKRFNPAEFAWQFAQLFDAEGYLISAPAVVDSVQTKQALLDNCGLEQVLNLAEGCDFALFSCGEISSLMTSYRSGHVSEAERKSLIRAGAVGDVLYNFLNSDGEPIQHSVNDRSISMSIDRLRRIPNKVLISGGVKKKEIISATLKSLQPSVFVTDEITAQCLLDKLDSTNGEAL